MKAAAIDQLQGVENEVKTLRTLTSRMALTQKEMVCTRTTLFSFLFRITLVINACSYLVSGGSGS